MSTNSYLPFRAPILRKTRQTDTDWTYRLGCTIRPVSGQFAEVSIPGVGECPISISDFGMDYIELTIRKVGKVTQVIEELEQAEFLYVRGPYGTGFPVENFFGKHLIITAGGTGLAPVKSIINRFYREPHLLTRLHVLAGFKSPEDILFKDEIKLWNETFPVEVTVDRAEPNHNWEGHVGLITTLIPEIEIPQLDQTQVIVVGPPSMMKYTVQEFLKRGIKEEQIWVSFERKMCCGLGKCGHCRIDDTYVCLDGPVFNYTQAKNLVD